MIYLSLAVNLIVIIVAILAVRSERQRAERYLDREAARVDELTLQAREREDQLLNRIQEPKQAAARSMTEQAGPIAPGHISAFDDVALAEYEQNIHKLELSTRELVEQYDGSADPEPVPA